MRDCRCARQRRDQDELLRHAAHPDRVRHEGFRREFTNTLAPEPDIKVVADVSNGEDAIQCVRALRPHGLDLVLMDIDMPIMNGIDATAEILISDPSLAVIILTVSTLDRDLFAGVRSGAVGFLNKGLSPSTLTRTLRDFDGQ
jgi:DNA-binding NarL/FixJ family response regulator